MAPAGGQPGPAESAADIRAALPAEAILQSQPSLVQPRTPPVAQRSAQSVATAQKVSASPRNEPEARAAAGKPEEAAMVGGVAPWAEKGRRRAAVDAKVEEQQAPNPSLLPVR